MIFEHLSSIKISRDSLLRSAEAISKPGMREFLLDSEYWLVFIKEPSAIGTPGPSTISNLTCAELSLVQFSGRAYDTSKRALEKRGNLASLSCVYIE